MAKAKSDKPAKTGTKRDVGYKNPPVETQFKPGNQAAKGHGRPKDLKQLRTLIRSIAAEDSTVKPGLNKLEAMIDRMLISPQSADRKEILRYGWGEPPTDQRTLNVNLSDLSDAQLEMLANGADLLTVLAAAGAGGTRTEKAPEGDSGQAAA